MSLPIKRQFETVEITPDLAKNVSPIEVKPGCMVSMVTAALTIKDNKYTLEVKVILGSDLVLSVFIHIAYRYYRNESIQYLTHKLYNFMPCSLVY